MPSTILARCGWCSAEWRKPWPEEDDGEPTHSICPSCLDERYPEEPS